MRLSLRGYHSTFWYMTLSNERERASDDWTLGELCIKFGEPTLAKPRFFGAAPEKISIRRCVMSARAFAESRRQCCPLFGRLLCVGWLQAFVCIHLMRFAGFAACHRRGFNDFPLQAHRVPSLSTSLVDGCNTAASFFSQSCMRTCSCCLNAFCHAWKS